MENSKSSSYVSHLVGFWWRIRGLYTGGKGPESLFIRQSWDLMCHASSAHLWWKLGCPSITVALLQSMSWPSSTVCCDTPDRCTSPDTSVLLWSLRRCGATYLADVHLSAGSAGDLIDHAWPVFGLNTILQVYKHPSQSIHMFFTVHWGMPCSTGSATFSLCMHGWWIQRFCHLVLP